MVETLFWSVIVKSLKINKVKNSKLKLVLEATVVALAITFLGIALLHAMDLIEKQNDLMNLIHFN